jgi:hypothetical protein
MRGYVKIQENNIKTEVLKPFVEIDHSCGLIDE